MDAFNFVLTCTIVVSLATALLAVWNIWQAKLYRAWKAEFDRKGIQWPVCEVLKGSEVVGYCYIGERRSNRV